MLPALTLLFICQLTGEIIVRGLDISFPGPVLGMGLFFVLVALTWFGPTSGFLGHVIGPPIDWMLGLFESLASWIAR